VGVSSACAAILVAPLVLPLAACVLPAFFTSPSLAQPRPPSAGGPTRAPTGATTGAPVVGTPLPGTRILAVVNGDVITSGDVENRARLFALSTGLSTTPR